jgi:hypothetical protein
MDTNFLPPWMTGPRDMLLITLLSHCSRIENEACFPFNVCNGSKADLSRQCPLRVESGHWACYQTRFQSFRKVGQAATCSGPIVCPALTLLRGTAIENSSPRPTVATSSLRVGLPEKSKLSL